VFQNRKRNAVTKWDSPQYGNPQHCSCSTAVQPPRSTAKDIRASREKAPELCFWQPDPGREVVEARLKEALGVSAGLYWDSS